MTTTPKERPILFSGPMVRAILDGRKTQTRRVIKHRENRWECSDDGATGKVWPYWPCYVYGEPEPVEMPCPYGKPGDRLWVRETHMIHGGEIAYAATDQNLVGCDRWKPSIHMPRWASRITLEITAVRVERLQDISEADAMAEGVLIDGIGNPGGPMRVSQRAFKIFWQVINGPESWAANPWVWVVEFRKTEKES